MKKFGFGFLVLLLFIGSFDLMAQQKAGFAFEQNKKLGRGVNILDGDPRWVNTEKTRMNETHFKLIRDAGFSNVRIVLHPFRSMKSETDFTLNYLFFNTLDWAINQSLANGLMPIVDFHEHSAMGKDPLGNKARFLATWEQIAAHCKNYPSEVVFEICNEPNMESAIWNELHSDAHKIIRNSNPDRTILIGSRNANQIRFLQDLILPEYDRNIIVPIHYYSPSQFTHQGASWSAKNKDLSGIEWTNKESEENAIISDFEIAREWSEKNNRPLTLGEFGVYEKADMASRVRWTNFVSRQAEKRNWSWSYWEFNAGFGIFNHGENAWKKELLDALIPPKI
jgi:endoglucanase